jgi:predicted transcriptional regulator
MGELYRTQVLLERKQHESLQQLAAAEGRSMSEIIREAVAEYLFDQADKTASWKETLAQMARLREEIRAESGEFPEEIILNDRAEREDELAYRMWGDHWQSS